MQPPMGQVLVHDRLEAVVDPDPSPPFPERCRMHPVLSPRHRLDLRIGNHHSLLSAHRPHREVRRPVYRAFERSVAEVQGCPGFKAVFRLNPSLAAMGRTPGMPLQCLHEAALAGRLRHHPPPFSRPVSNFALVKPPGVGVTVNQN